MKKHGDKDLTLLCGSYFAVPFPGAFDAVISFESLHHFLPEKSAGSSNASMTVSRLAAYL